MKPRSFVSRGGDKLAAALEAFEIDPRGLICADFGCNVGGFTDCLLRGGAAQVFAVDTGYGELAWTLRRDQRVVVMERTNALYCPPAGPVDLVVIDVARTSQALIVPAAMRWLRPADPARPAPTIISLLKPHYEQAQAQGRPPSKPLEEAQGRQVCLRVCGELAAAGVPLKAVMPSPLIGKGGNREFLLLVQMQMSHEG